MPTTGAAMDGRRVCGRGGPWARPGQLAGDSGSRPGASPAPSALPRAPREALRGGGVVMTSAASAQVWSLRPHFLASESKSASEALSMADVKKAGKARWWPCIGPWLVGRWELPARAWWALVLTTLSPSASASLTPAHAALWPAGEVVQHGQGVRLHHARRRERGHLRAPDSHPVHRLPLPSRGAADHKTPGQAQRAGRRPKVRAPPAGPPSRRGKQPQAARITAPPAAAATSCCAGRQMLGCRLPWRGQPGEQRGRCWRIPRLWAVPACAPPAAPVSRRNGPGVPCLTWCRKFHTSRGWDTHQQRRSTGGGAHATSLGDRVARVCPPHAFSAPVAF